MSTKKIIGIVVVIIVIIIGIGFASGELTALYNKTVGKDVTNSENVKFHSSQIYNDSMAKDLADAKRELGQTTDPAARGAIIDDINKRYANFNADNLEDKDLKQFLLDIRNGNLK